LAHEGRKWPTSGRNILPLGQRGQASDLVKNDTERLEKLFELYTKMTGAKAAA
jgi:hypothetical protein